MYQETTTQRSQTAPSDLKLMKAVDEGPGSLASVANLRDEFHFSKWYGEVENDLLEASYDEYQSCLTELQASRSYLDSILSDTSSTLSLLSTLSQSFQAVELQTSSFQKQCEGLLAAQRRDAGLASNIEENLRYYDFLEPASRKLNAPGAGNTVRGRDFSDMLRRLDECIDYMEAHPEQREAEIYRSRYRLLLTRALTLVRGYFVSTVRDIYSDVSKKIAGKQLNDAAMSASLYAKFRIAAPDMKQIGLEIQKRAVPPPDTGMGTEGEYQSLVNELQSSFSATRSRLILPLVRKKLNEIAQAPSSSTDLVAFSRASISYIRGVCLDEFDLWGEWFYGDGALYDLLETVCEPLYDYLRPRIIREDRIVKLCQLCTLLQTRYLLDQDDETELVDTRQLDFTALIQPALEDAQTRLVFRAQAFLRGEIERYKPRPEDIDVYSHNRQTSLLESNNHISGRKVIATDVTVGLRQPTKAAEDGAVDGASDLDMKWDYGSRLTSDTWYPTLRKAIWLLSKIYRLVNSIVFDDLAHQIVHQTNISIHQASVLVTNKVTPADGQLFLMSHLLVLKQQIVAFDIEYVAPEVQLDFSGITGTFWELRERGGLFNPRNLMRLVGHGLLPRVIENMLDAKVELDGRLRTVINEFIDSFASKMTASLPIKFIDTRNLHDDELIHPVCSAIEKEVPALRQLLDSHFVDVRMKETLVGAVQDRVIRIYEDFFDRYTSEEKKRGNAVSSKGKGRKGAAWDVDTFVEWCEDIFRVDPTTRDEDDAVSVRSSNR